MPNINLLPPLDYLLPAHLAKRARLVLTDSRAMQEEATGLGKPVLVLGEVTERPEAVEAGRVWLAGTDRERVMTEAVHLLEETAAYAAMCRGVNPYGDGRAAERIMTSIQRGER